MADPVSRVPYDAADMTDPANPLARYHTEGKIAGAGEAMTEAAFQHMITEGKIAAGMARWQAEQAAATRAERDAQRFRRQPRAEASISGGPLQTLFLDPPE